MKALGITLSLFLLFPLMACGQDDSKDQLYNPSTSTVVTDTAFFVTFEDRSVATYTDTHIKEDFKNIEWVSTYERAKIVEDAERGKVLEIFYPEGAVGPSEGGIQFVRTLPSNSSYYLDYYLKFDEKFDMQLGGKLPGLTSGGSTYTGGVQPTEGDGWSARYMWTDNNSVLYLYYVDMSHEYGEPIDLGMKFANDKWYRVTQYIKVNDEDEENAEIKVWIDGKLVLEKQDFRLRIGKKGAVNSFYFSTFHGGSTDEWAPSNDCYTYYDDILVTLINPL